MTRLLGFNNTNGFGGMRLFFFFFLRKHVTFADVIFLPFSVYNMLTNITNLTEAIDIQTVNVIARSSNRSSSLPARPDEDILPIVYIQ